MLKKILFSVLKFGISFAILGFLFYRAQQDDAFNQLKDQEKNWGLLVGACAIAMAAVSLTYVRWFLLVRALSIPFQLKDAFRLGFMGYLLNFFTLGVVGGDALKAVFISRQFPGRRTEVVASVLLDRIIGLFALFIVASIAFFNMDFSAIIARDSQQLLAVQRTGQIAFGVTMAGFVCFALAMLPGSFASSLVKSLARIPRLAWVIARLEIAVRVYRRRVGVLVISVAMSLLVHAMNVFSVYLIAGALPGGQPSLTTHFVIVPISLLAGAIPLPGGLGAFELVLDSLYRGVSTQAMIEGQGFVIALGYRVITLLIAAVGVVFYLVSRRQVTQWMHEAEQSEEWEPNEERILEEQAPTAS